MTAVEYMDSTGLGVLALANGKLKEVGRQPRHRGRRGAGFWNC